MDNLTYFDRLHDSITRIARHSFYPGKEEAVEQCLEEIEHLRDCARISDDQLARLRDVLLGEENACLAEGVAREFDHARSGDDEADGIAIVCEGMGSHAAFAAGVLQGLLRAWPPRPRIAALAGSSFGAVNAAIAWEGLLRGDLPRAAEQLDHFWQEYSAHSLIGVLLNYSSQMVQQLRDAIQLPGFPHCALAFATPHAPETQLEHQLDLGLVRALAGFEGAPRLVVDQGDAGCHPINDRGESLTLGDLLPSELGSHPRPDRLFDTAGSVGVPRTASLIRSLARSKPREIWLIRTQRVASRWPGSSRAVAASREPQAEGRLLARELDFLRTINRLLDDGALVDDRYRRIEVHQIIMEHELDESSNIDRSPGFIAHLLAYGRDRARQFLAKWSAMPSRRPGRPQVV